MPVPEALARHRAFSLKALILTAKSPENTRKMRPLPKPAIARDRSGAGWAFGGVAPGSPLATASNSLLLASQRETVCTIPSDRDAKGTQRGRTLRREMSWHYERYIGAPSHAPPILAVPVLFKDFSNLDWPLGGKSGKESPK